MKENELRTALLISGGGTTAEAVIKACRSGELKGIIPVAVIASRPDAGGVQKAEGLAVKTFVVQRRDFPNEKLFGNRLLEILGGLRVDLVSQNGWLVKTPPNVVKEFQGRIVNQHPGPLDPGKGRDFGGKGMYGARVSCARLAYQWVAGEKNPWTESTIHHVTDEYDQGELIRVVRMTVPSIPSPVTIAQLRKDSNQLVDTTRGVQGELLPLEHKNVIAVLGSFARGEQPRFDRSEPLIPPGAKDILCQAKELAIELFPKG